MGRSRRGTRIVAVLIAVVWACGGCAEWALSTGDALERAAVQAGSEMQTLRLTAAAGQQDPAPAVMLDVVLADIEAALAEAATEASGGDGAADRRAALLALIEDGRRVVPEVRAALHAGDDAALGRTGERAGGIAAGLDEWRAR